MSISLVAGLGNPGREYERSRHNLGWVVLDAYASKHGLSWKGAPEFESVVARRDLGPGRTLWLVKPQTFMNESGRAVAALARYHRIAPAVGRRRLRRPHDRPRPPQGLGLGQRRRPQRRREPPRAPGNGFARLPPRDRPEAAARRWTSRTSCSPASHQEQLTLIQQKTDTYVQAWNCCSRAAPTRR
jgi:hypothetical protein